MKLQNPLLTPLAAVFLLGVWAASATAQVTPRPPAGAAPATRPAPAPSGTSVAVIDLNEVFKKHARFQAALSDIKKDTEGLNGEMRTQQKTLQKMVEELKDFKPGTPEYKQKEEEIAHVDSNVRVQLQLKRKELREREAKLYYHAYEEVLANVEDFAERNGIALVIRFSADEIDPTNPESIMMGLNRQVVFQRNLNITEFVIERLNRQTPVINNTQRPAPIVPGRPMLK